MTFSYRVYVTNATRFIICFISLKMKLMSIMKLINYCHCSIDNLLSMSIVQKSISNKVLPALSLFISFLLLSLIINHL